MLSEAITERTWVSPPHGNSSSSQLPFSPACSASFCFGTSECKNVLQWFHFPEKRAERKLHCWASSTTPIAVIANWQLEQLAEMEAEERSWDSKGQGTCQEEVKTLTHCNWQMQILACTHGSQGAGEGQPSISNVRTAKHPLANLWLQFQTWAMKNKPINPHLDKHLNQPHFIINFIFKNLFYYYVVSF